MLKSTREFAERQPLFIAITSGFLFSLLTASSPLFGMQVGWLPKKDPTLAMLSAYILSLSITMTAPRLILLREWSYKEFRRHFLANFLTVVSAIPLALLLVIAFVILIGLVGYGLQLDPLLWIEQTNLVVLLMTGSCSAVVWYLHGQVQFRIAPHEGNIKREWATMLAVAIAFIMSLGIYILDMMLVPKSTGFPRVFECFPSVVTFNLTVFIQVAGPLLAFLVYTNYTKNRDLSH